MWWDSARFTYLSQETTETSQKSLQIAVRLLTNPDVLVVGLVRHKWKDTSQELYIIGPVGAVATYSPPASARLVRPVNLTELCDSHHRIIPSTTLRCCVSISSLSNLERRKASMMSGDGNAALRNVSCLTITDSRTVQMNPCGIAQ